MNYIVIDLEYNQAYDFQDKNEESSCSNPDCPFEIIQIGAVKLDKNFNVLDTIDLFIKPQIYKRIHPYVEKLTGITNKSLAEKQDFLAAYEKLTEFITDKKSILCVWGGNDVKELYNNIQYYKLDGRKIPIRYINVQNAATLYLKNHKGASIGLKKAVESFNLCNDLPFHNALNDAKYTADILRELRNENLIIQKFSIKNFSKENKIKKSQINTSQLYAFIEKEMGRRLSTKEKLLFRNVYLLGRNKKYDL